MLVKLTGLDGSAIYISGGVIFRVRAAIPEEGPAATRIDYGGGMLLTNEAVGSLVGRLDPACMIEFTTAAGTPVFLNIKAISRVRRAAGSSLTDIAIGGQRQDVSETVNQVVALVDSGP